MSYHYASARCDSGDLSDYAFHHTMEDARVRAKSFSSRDGYFITKHDPQSPERKARKKGVISPKVVPPIVRGYVFELVLDSRVVVNGLKTTITGGDVHEDVN